MCVCLSVCQMFGKQDPCCHSVWGHNGQHIAKKAANDELTAWWQMYLSTTQIHIFHYILTLNIHLDFRYYDFLYSYICVLCVCMSFRLTWFVILWLSLILSISQLTLWERLFELLRRYVWMFVHISALV